VQTHMIKYLTIYVRETSLSVSKDKVHSGQCTMVFDCQKNGF